MTTEAREQAIKQLRDYRRDRAEADNVSLSLDARMWEVWRNESPKRRWTPD
jgi:hypothetical protein